ncbi:hypothetical protein ACHWQZ_G017511 [Mnemiopsis leidyi]
MTSSYSWSNLEDSAKPRAKTFLCLQVTCLVLALLVLIFTLVLFPIVFLNLVNQQVALTNGTLSFDQWLAPTPAIFKIVTVYNITNPAEVRAGGRPVVEALGPYYFREYRERVRVEEVYDQELWFGEKKWYEFDNSTTNKGNNGSTKLLDPVKDIFTTINLAYVGVAFNLTYSGTPAEIFVAVAAAMKEHEVSLFMNRSVNDVVFGYKDKFLTDLKIFMPTLSDTVQIVYNMSDRDIHTTSKILNGRKNVSDLGQYTQWQGYTKLPYWITPEAATINGTEGLFFAPNLDKTKPITTFVDDLFRANPMEFVEEEEVMGLNTYKYEIPQYVMMNATNNPLNKGFYAYGPNGMMNLTAAVMAPVFVSKPSFLDSEPWLQDEIGGLPPANKTTMDTNLWVEPITGALVKAMKQLQANVMIENFPKFPDLKNLRSTPRYVPISKIIETGGMDDELVGTFKNKVFKPRDDFTIGLWVLFAVFVIVGGVMGGLHYRHVSNHQKDGSLLIPDEGIGSKGSNVYGST